MSGHATCLLLVCNWPVGEGVPQFGNKKGGGEQQPALVSALPGIPQVNTLLLKNKTKQNGKKKNPSCQADSNNSDRDIGCGLGNENMNISGFFF